MKYLLYIALALTTGCWLAHAASAQLVSVYNEVFYTDDGTIENYPPGATTYRIYGSLQGESDVLTAVYADSQNSLLLGTEGGSGIWNTEFGGIVGPDLGAAFFGIFPEAEYDSMVTIGRASDADLGGGVTPVSIAPSTSAIADVFGEPGVPFGGDLELTDGTWFSTPDLINTVGVGENNAVLLAQITTDGTLEYELNVQVVVNGVGGDPISYVWNGANENQAENTFDGSALGLIYPTDCAVTQATLEYSCAYEEGEVVHSAFLQMSTPSFCAPVSLSLLNATDLTTELEVSLDAVAPDLQDGFAVDVYDLLVVEGLAPESYFATVVMEGGEQGVELDLGEVSFACGIVPGCTDSTACNYNPEATDDNASCSFWENASADQSVPLHVYDLGSQQLFSGAWGCLDPGSGAWFCFEASDETVFMTLSTTAGVPTTGLYSADVTLLESGVPGTFGLSTPYGFENLTPGERYYLRLQLNDPIDPDGLQPFEVLLTGASGTPLLEDLNGDQLLSAADMVVFLGLYGDPDSAADLDGNGTVTTADLLLLLYAIFTAPRCD